MKGGYSPINQPWHSTVDFTAVLQSILLWTWKTPVSFWFMDPSGIWESNIHSLQPLIQRIQIVWCEWAAGANISTRKTWLQQRWTLLLTQMVFLQHSWVSILTETYNSYGGEVCFIWFSPKLAAAKKTSFQLFVGKGKQEGALQNSVEFQNVAIKPFLLSLKYQNVK